MQGRLAIRPRLDRGDLTHLHAAHLDFGVGVHHQAGARRHYRDWNGFGETAPEQAHSHGHNPGNDGNGRQTHQYAYPPV